MADGVVYVGSYDHKIYAFRAADGFQVWNYITGGIIVSRPSVAGGLVFVGSEDNNFYA